VGQSVDLKSDVVKIAVSEALFLESEAISWVPELESWFEHLRVILVVMGSQPNIDCIPGPWRWELEGIEGASFSWNKDKQDFDFHGGKDEVSRDNALFDKLAEGAIKGLREELLNRGLDHLEIRPIFVVRR